MLTARNLQGKGVVPMLDFVRRRNIANLQQLLLTSNPSPETQRVLLKLLTEEIARLPPPPPEPKKQNEA
jgi:hypothetical protein